MLTKLNLHKFDSLIDKCRSDFQRQIHACGNGIVQHFVYDVDAFDVTESVLYSWVTVLLHTDWRIAIAFYFFYYFMFLLFYGLMPEIKIEWLIDWLIDWLVEKRVAELEAATFYTEKNWQITT